MTLKLSLLLFFTCIVSFLSPTLSSVSNGIDYWCNQTPYPETCNYFMAQNQSTPHLVQNRDQFRQVSTKMAIEGALAAQTHHKQFNQQSRSKKEKLAWDDCMSLYEDTISLLNQTLDSKCTHFDIQTWLSSALTNLDTCRTGYEEFGILDRMSPLMANNVTKLICNTLAINNPLVDNIPETYRDGFPSWVGKNDRNLLRPAMSTMNSHVVAQDGSGNYSTINEAIKAAANRQGTDRFVIYINRGTYKENVEIGKKMKNVMFIGDGMGNTIITGSRSYQDITTTFLTATVAVDGDGFIARGITFCNTAGPQNHQAVALRSSSDLSVFYQCGFEGYQDTLYTHRNRQFYRECSIYGTVDMIFGDAAVVLQNCNIYLRRPMDHQQNTITAQGRDCENRSTGISIHNSMVMPAPDLKPVVGSFKTYLGRPWKQYSRTVYVQTYLDSCVHPAGWLEWKGDFALNTLYYGEYRNTGPGSWTSQRVRWGGYHVINDSDEASRFMVGNFIAGNFWLPETGVPFTSDL